MSDLHSIDENSLNELKSKYKIYSKNADQKIANVSKLKGSIGDTYSKIVDEVELHFKELIEKILDAKKCEIIQQMRLNYEVLECDANNAINEVNDFKSEIESAIRLIESKLNQNKSFYNEDDNNDDALMISEANEEILDTSMTNNFTSNQTTDINNNYSQNPELLRLENLMSTTLSINSVDAKLNQFVNQKFIPCKPNFDELCLGHLAFDSTLDHTHFQFENNSNDSLFVKNQKCSVKISSPAAYSRDINIHEFLKFDLFDPKRSAVNYELKERSSNTKRYTKITFTPETHGIYKLCIKYNNSYIQNCPFYFYVLKELNKTQLTEILNQNGVALNTTASSLVLSPTSEMSIALDSANSMIKNEPIEIVENHTTNQNLQNGGGDVTVRKSNERLNNNNNLGSTNSLSSRISAGRGRLFKQIINEQANKARASSSQVAKPIDGSSSNITINTIQSQKRKSPLINYFDENDVNDNDVELCEISTKLKKVVVDETNNQYFQYNAANQQAKSNFDFSRLNVNRTTKLNQSTSATSASEAVAYLDNHLRKYSSLKLGDMPPLKAVFQRKYASNMSFPIGVTACTSHNWVLVADNGNHSVKIFERTTGELVRELKGDVNDGATPFMRPSALLINANDSELYVKDDIQIQVFDLENNFKFKRRFGANLLKKPYGISLNTKENIVCVDANLSQPLIYTFDKNGQVLNSKSFQPVIEGLTSSLNYPNLSKKIAPFDKCKIRFIYCSQNCLYSSDLGRSIVYKTTLDGEILFAFGHYGRHKGEINEPSGLYVDHNGTILVGDSKNSRLQIYDNQGKYKCDIEFVDEKIRRPSDIFLDEDGYLYVTCFLDHCVKKYKLIES